MFDKVKNLLVEEKENLVEENLAAVHRAQVL